MKSFGMDGYLTLQQGSSRRYGLWYAVFTVNGLEELWNAVVFIDNDDAHLKDSSEKEAER